MQLPHKTGGYLDRRLYLRSVYGRWKKEIAKGENEIRVFSPYLTSKVAERVAMAARDRGRCEIYTHFASEDFVSGASSIGTLRHLKESGFPLYELPGLHAKIVIVKGNFATIGSQNVTTNGTRRREATYATTRAIEVDRLWSDTAEWCKERSEITLEMIQDMEARIPDLVREYEEIRTRCAESDSRVREAESRRRAEQEELDQIIQMLVEKQQTDRSQKTSSDERLRSARGIASERWRNERRKSMKMARTKVYRVEEESDYRWTSRFTLKTTDGSNLTRWMFDDGKMICLTGQQRYPCLIHGIWKLGFARVNKTCITFVGDSIYRKCESIGNLSCAVTFTGNWKAPEDDFNVTCRLKIQDEGWELEVPAWFGIDEIELREPRRPKDSAGIDAKSALDWYEQNRSGIKDKLLDLLLASFRYQRSLIGVQADSFFGDSGSVHQVEIAEIRGQPVLVVRRLG